MVDSSTSQASVRLERVFDAPLDLVWSMWTDPVKTRLPNRPVLLGPRRDLNQRARVQRARPVLGAVPALDETRPLEHLEVLGDRWELHLKRLGQFVDGRLARGETRQDRPPGRARERGERLRQPLFVVKCRHGSFHLG